MDAPALRGFNAVACAMLALTFHACSPEQTPAVAPSAPVAPSAAADRVDERTGPVHFTGTPPDERTDAPDPPPQTVTEPDPTDQEAAAPGVIDMLPDYGPGRRFRRTVTLDRESEFVLDDGSQTSRTTHRSRVEIAYQLAILEGTKWALRSFELTFDTVVVDGAPSDGQGLGEDPDEPGPRPGDVWTCALDGGEAHYACTDVGGEERALPTWMPIHLVRLMPGDPVSAGARWTRRTGVAPLLGLRPDDRATARMTLGSPFRSETGQHVETSITFDGESTVTTFDQPTPLDVEGSGILAYNVGDARVASLDLRWAATGDGVQISGDRRLQWSRTMHYVLRATNDRID